MNMYRHVNLSEPLYVGDPKSPISFTVHQSNVKSPVKFLYLSATAKPDLVPYDATLKKPVFQAYVKLGNTSLDYARDRIAVRVYMLLDIITAAIPSLVRFGYQTNGPSGSRFLHEWSFWFKFLCSISQISSDLDYENSLGIPFSNPLNQMSAAFMNTAPFPATHLRNKAILLSYSGGKESVFAQTILNTLGVSHAKAKIYDSFQSQNKVDMFGEDDEEHAVHMTHLNCSVSLPFSRLFANMGNHVNHVFPYSRLVPVVPIQRLLMSLYALDRYDHLYFGDEAEQQVLYRVKYRGENVTYPTHTFFQSQLFYNMLNVLVFKESGLSLHTPVRNFTQPHILQYLADRQVQIDSCLHLHGAWCGKCAKCANISKQATLLYGHAKVPEMATFRGLEGRMLMAEDHPSDRKSIQALTAISMFSEHQHQAQALNYGLEGHIDRLQKMRGDWVNRRFYPVFDEVCCTPFFDQEAYTRLLP
jgi:hypothetical protein